MKIKILQYEVINGADQDCEKVPTVHVYVSHLVICWLNKPFVERETQDFKQIN